MNLPKVSGKLRHTFIEGWLYWYTAFGVTAQEFLSSEEAYKYCNPVLLFWLRMFLGSSVAGFNAVKAFRSMTFGRAYGNPPEPTLEVKPTTVQTTVAQPSSGFAKPGQ